MDNTKTAMRQSVGPVAILLMCLIVALAISEGHKKDAKEQRPSNAYHTE